MEYTINGFVNKLRDMMYQLFPSESETLKMAKHSTRPLHIKDIAFMYLPINASIDGNTITFDIGSTYAEEYYPYYHILQDAPVIRKRNKGDEKTRGSQAKVSNLGKRDYGRVDFNGKTFTREYEKNVRGKRESVVNKSTQYIYMGGQKIKINRSANSYKNIHYHYIDNMLNVIAPEIANYFGLKLKRVSDSGLKEEYDLQSEEDKLGYKTAPWEEETSIADIVASHDIGDE